MYVIRMVQWGKQSSLKTERHIRIHTERAREREREREMVYLYPTVVTAFHQRLGLHVSLTWLILVVLWDPPQYTYINTYINTTYIHIPILALSPAGVLTSLDSLWDVIEREERTGVSQGKRKWSGGGGGFTGGFLLTIDTYLFHLWWQNKRAIVRITIHPL